MKRHSGTYPMYSIIPLAFCRETVKILSDASKEILFVLAYFVQILISVSWKEISHSTNALVYCCSACFGNLIAIPQPSCVYYQKNKCQFFCSCWCETIFIAELPDNNLFILPLWKHQVTRRIGGLYLGICSGATSWWTQDDIFHGSWRSSHSITSCLWDASCDRQISCHLVQSAW